MSDAHLDDVKDVRAGQGYFPRFTAENYERNHRLVETLERIAERLHVAPAQVALAWVLAQGDDVVPIPGTKRVKWLEQNVAAGDVALDAATLQELEDAFPIGVAAGDRYADMSTVNR